MFQALCLEQLTASHFLSSLAEKMNIQVSEVSSLVRLTVSGIMVMVDDNVSGFTNQDHSVLLYTFFFQLWKFLSRLFKT